MGVGARLQRPPDLKKATQVNKKRLAIFASVAVAVLVIAAGAFNLLRDSDGDDGFAMPASAASRQDVARSIKSESVAAQSPRRRESVG
jgi:hypothetical protein